MSSRYQLQRAVSTTSTAAATTKFIDRVRDLFTFYAIYFYRSEAPIPAELLCSVPCFSYIKLRETLLFNQRKALYDCDKITDFMFANLPALLPAYIRSQRILLYFV